MIIIKIVNKLQIKWGKILSQKYEYYNTKIYRI
jgi:hypothetical protein